MLHTTRPLSKPIQQATNSTTNNQKLNEQQMLTLSDCKGRPVTLSPTDQSKINAFIGFTQQSNLQSQKQTPEDPLQNVKKKTMSKESDLFMESIVHGFSQPLGQRVIDSKWLHDKKGLRLLENFSSSDEHFLSRSEHEILTVHGDKIVEELPSNLDGMIIIEIGNGSMPSATKLLIESILRKHNRCHYICVGLEEDVLKERMENVYQDFRTAGLKMETFVGTPIEGVKFCAKKYPSKSKIVVMFANALGTFETDERFEFMNTLRYQLTIDDRLLLGIDLKKDRKALENTYDDCKGKMAAFNLNVLTRINRELDSNIDLSQWKHKIQYCQEEACLHVYLVSQSQQSIRIGLQEFQFEKGEAINTLSISQFSSLAIDSLACSSSFRVKSQYKDAQSRFALTVLTPDHSSLMSVEKASNTLRNAWNYSDTIFETLDQTNEAFSYRPISQKQSFMFYRGHIPAFSLSCLRFGIDVLNDPNGVLEQQMKEQLEIKKLQQQTQQSKTQNLIRDTRKRKMSINPYDQVIPSPNIKHRSGISHVRSNSDKCDEYDSVFASLESFQNADSAIDLSFDSLERYIRGVRNALDKSLPIVLQHPNAKQQFMFQKGRLFSQVSEHEFQVAETLLNMLTDTPEDMKRVPSQKILNYQYATTDYYETRPKNEMILIPAGHAILGADHHEVEWGWDVEFPKTEVPVEEFMIDALPVSNQDFLEFVECGAYNDPSYWEEEDWLWKQSTGLKCPHIWKKTPNGYVYRTIFHELPLDKVLDWPVYVSQAEACAYSQWKGKRLPTEAELIRAAYGKNLHNCDQSPALSMKNPQEISNKYPWGSEAPKPGVHGNFELYSWAPTPVGSFSAGKSDFGLYDVVGNGWEWTSSHFDCLPGFEPFVENVKNSAISNFDDHHFVLIGASFATSTNLIRRSFRKWHTSNYQYVFAKFRCCQSVSDMPISAKSSMSKLTSPICNLQFTNDVLESENQRTISRTHSQNNLPTIFCSKKLVSKVLSSGSLPMPHSNEFESLELNENHSTNSANTVSSSHHHKQLQQENQDKEKEQHQHQVQTHHQPLKSSRSNLVPSIIVTPNIPTHKPKSQQQTETNSNSKTNNPNSNPTTSTTSSSLKSSKSKDHKEKITSPTDQTQTQTQTQQQQPRNLERRRHSRSLSTGMTSLNNSNSSVPIYTTFAPKKTQTIDSTNISTKPLTQQSETSKQHHSNSISGHIRSQSTLEESLTKPIALHLTVPSWVTFIEKSNKQNKHERSSSGDSRISNGGNNCKTSSTNQTNTMNVLRNSDPTPLQQQQQKETKKSVVHISKSQSLPLNGLNNNLNPKNVSFDYATYQSKSQPATRTNSFDHVKT